MTSVAMTPHQKFSEQDPSEIRLIQLFPGDRKAASRCELVTVSLTSQPKPIYLALSYTWGNPDNRKIIHLQGQDYLVTANLSAFLRQFQEIISLVCKGLPHPIFLTQFVLPIIILSLPRGWQNWPKDRRDEAICSNILPYVSKYVLDHTKVDSEATKLLKNKWSPQDLRDLCHHPSALINLWVDAICINQDDDHEKSTQIPLMSDIYQSAMRVLIWLGDNSPISADNHMDDNMVDEIYELMNIIGKCAQQFPSLDFNNIVAKVAGSEVSFERSTDLLAKLIGKHQWFKRMWIIQEVSATTVDPLVYLGHHKFAWDNISQLCNFLARATFLKPTIMFTDANQALGNIVMLDTVRKKHQKKVKQVLSEEASEADVYIASNLYHLIKLTACAFESTQPVDRLYALVGLATYKMPMPRLLKPNYEISFGQVFHEYAAYLVEQTKDLSILSPIHPHRDAKKDMAGVPSWTPDWRDLMMPPQPPKTKAHQVTFYNDHRELELQGVRIGEVESWRPTSSNEVGARFGGNTVEFQSTKIGDYLQGREEVSMEADTTSQPLDQTSSTLVNVDNLTRQTEYELALMKHRPPCLLLSLTNGCLAVIDQKAQCPTGGTVCMLRGAYMPSLLLPTDGEKYRFVSVCEVAGINDPDEDYYRQHELESFVLV